DLTETASPSVAEPVLVPLALEAGGVHEVVVEYVADDDPGTAGHVVLGWHPPGGAADAVAEESVSAAAAADVAVVLVRAESTAPDDTVLSDDTVLAGAPATV